MFEEFGETIGLNFDPSHLVWLMIDIGSAIEEFGERFYHFQAKDVMIDYDGLYENGTLSSGIGWQVPRLPGLGHVDWGVVFSALYRAGYDGPIIIEHEDRGFEATDELVKRGFLLARDVLQPYVH
jgi:sugar phosphate isomerase/epimerase